MNSKLIKQLISKLSYDIQMLENAMYKEKDNNTELAELYWGVIETKQLTIDHLFRQLYG